MSRARKAFIAVAVTGLIILGAAAWWLLPIVTGPALPAGATRLHITTEGPGLPFACAAAALAPARVSTTGDELVLVAVENGNPINVVWPSGFAAWRLNGQAVLADPWGHVVGREGDVLDGLGGGLGLGDDFHICPLGIPTEP